MTAPVGRCGGERGSGLVGGITLIFAFTFLAIVWLAQDVDRAVSNRSAAQSIAFQAARSGAQATAIGDLRVSGGTPTVDERAARLAALRTAEALFVSYGLTGTVETITVTTDSVAVTVTVDDAGITVTGAGTARSERAP